MGPCCRGTTNLRNWFATSTGCRGRRFDVEQAPRTPERLRREDTARKPTGGAESPIQAQEAGAERRAKDECLPLSFLSAVAYRAPHLGVAMAYIYKKKQPGYVHPLSKVDRLPKILELLNSGNKLIDIARQYGLSRQRVHRILDAEPLARDRRIKLARFRVKITLWLKSVGIYKCFSCGIWHEESPHGRCHECSRQCMNERRKKK